MAWSTASLESGSEPQPSSDSYHITTRTQAQMSFGLVERGMLGHISPYYGPKQVAICKVDCISFLSISNVMRVMSGWQFRLKILPRRIRVSCVHVFLGLLTIWAALKAMWFYTLPTFQAFCIHKATRENCLHYLAL